MLNHLGALIKVSSEINQKFISLELAQCINLVLKRVNLRKDMIASIRSDQDIRAHIKTLTIDILESVDSENKVNILPIRIPSKRGRKPKFLFHDPMISVSQVTAIGHCSLNKAS